MLVFELGQDLEDNGKLDCLFNNPTYHLAEESLDAKNKRIRANWTSECAFDAM